MVGRKVIAHGVYVHARLVRAGTDSPVQLGNHMSTIFAASMVVNLRSAQRDVRHDSRSRVGRDLGLCCRSDFIRAFWIILLAKLWLTPESAQLFWSILLLCLGRHPSQNPHHFTPDIGQVPRAIVDKLPLVIYIPPPPDQPSKPVTLPSDLHTYPPKSTTSRRFFFLPFRRRNASTGNNTVKSGSMKEKKGSNRPSTWEDNWVKGEYPFVQLENHRASCAICLLDFQEPRRVSSGPDVPITPVENQTTEVPETRQEGEGDHEGDITEQVTTPATPATPLTPLTPTSPIGDLALRLQDAGEGAQPLRLLKCGHVFHVSPLLPLLACVSNANDPFSSKKENVCGPVVARCIGTVSSVPASSA